MFPFCMCILFVPLICHSVAHEEIIDPEVLASASAPTSNTFWTNYSLDKCEEWDTWEASEEVQDVWHYYRNGYDNEGNVVYVSEFGKLSYRKLAMKSDEVINDFWKYYEQSILRCEYDAFNQNDSTDGVVMLYDFEGFTLANYASVPALELSLKTFIGFERLNRAISYGFIFNANFAGESFLELAKPFLGDALNRFEIYGTRANKWKPKLLSKMPASSLPPTYGGDQDWKPLSNHVCNT